MRYYSYDDDDGDDDVLLTVLVWLVIISLCKQNNEKRTLFQWNLFDYLHTLKKYVLFAKESFLFFILRHNELIHIEAT